MSSGSAGVLRVFALRHAEREDHANPLWSSTAFRTHDSPLSLRGRAQASEVGDVLRARLPDDYIIYTSPLARCVETMSLIVEALGGEERSGDVEGARVESGLAEDEDHLRPRMLGTHHSVGPEGLIAPDGSRRVPTSPVLLTAGDLVGHARPARLNVAYRSGCTVQYNAEGFEVDGAGNRRADLTARVAEAMAAVCDGARTSSETVLLVTHGGVLKELTNVLCAGAVDRERPVAYVELVELVRSSVEAPWRLVGDTTYVLPSLRGDLVGIATKLKE